MNYIENDTWLYPLSTEFLSPCWFLSQTLLLMYEGTLEYSEGSCSKRGLETNWLNVTCVNSRIWAKSLLDFFPIDLPLLPIPHLLNVLEHPLPPPHPSFAESVFGGAALDITKCRCSPVCLEVWLQSSPVSFPGYQWKPYIITEAVQRNCVPCLVLSNVRNEWIQGLHFLPAESEATRYSLLKPHTQILHMCASFTRHHPFSADL